MDQIYDLLYFFQIFKCEHILKLFTINGYMTLLQILVLQHAYSYHYFYLYLLPHEFLCLYIYIYILNLKTNIVIICRPLNSVTNAHINSIYFLIYESVTQKTML